VKLSRCALAVFCLALFAPPAARGDWPGWRGPGQGGVSEEGPLPERWSATDNLRFQAPLPGRGVSGPVVARGRVFLTAASGVKGDRLHVLSFDAASGARLWERQLLATGSTQCHPKTCMAAPTPATDGERVYALFASCDLACLDREGTLLWYRSLALDYPDLSNQVGMAASPVLFEGSLIMALETDSDSFALSLDGASGRNRWKLGREKGINWATPLIARIGGREVLLLQSHTGLAAHDPLSAAKVWSYAAALDPVASPVAEGGVVYAPAGEVFAIRPGPAAQEPKLLWKSGKARTSMASPLVYQGRLYTVNSAGVLSCAGVEDGKLLWQERLSGTVSASPVAGAGKIYCVNEEGLCFVVSTSATPRLIAQNPLGETILASPAISGGMIYFRSDRRLLAVGTPAVAAGMKELSSPDR
jgi:outer membrane protein assembly factor BamB